MSKNNEFMREFVDLLKKHQASFDIIDNKIIVDFDEQLEDSDCYVEAPERRITLEKCFSHDTLIWGGYYKKDK